MYPVTSLYVAKSPLMASLLLITTSSKTEPGLAMEGTVAIDHRII